MDGKLELENTGHDFCDIANQSTGFLHKVLGIKNSTYTELIRTSTTLDSAGSNDRFVFNPALLKAVGG